MSVLAAAGKRTSPREKFRQRFLDRVRLRRGEVSLPFELEYRNIFVVPTAFGLAFGTMLAFMAVGGLNFNNNMALLLVFSLASIAQLTTVLAYRNLVGLNVAGIRAEPVFCGETARFRVYLGNRDDRPRFAIQAGFRAAQDCRDVPTRATAVLGLSREATRRGWLTMEPFKLETRYPLGLFRAWSWFFPEACCLVYPEPARHVPPLPRLGSGQAGRSVTGEGEQVHGLREYRHGDSMRRVAWRTSARHGLLYTREMETPREESCEISWDLLPGVDLEARLSILTAWVLMADHRQVSYSLLLPGVAIPAGLGVAHRARCLEALALHGP